MPAELESDLKLQIAHVLTIDVVAYSTLLIHEQSAVMTELNRVVRNTARFRSAEAEGKLTRLPTGDGMALVFFADPEAPIECAMEVSAALKGRPDIPLRMGIHSGPISQIPDVNDRSNVAGAGIDLAQRVMDCGDAGHILVSRRVADDLAPYSRWNPYLHDLGEYEVKHRRRIALYNFYNETVGNPQIPTKLRETKPAAPPKHATPRPTASANWARSWKVGVVALAAVALALGSWALLRKGAATADERAATGIPEKSIAVLPFENRSEEKANAYFADSIQDEILTRLSKIADLKVISRTSTQHYKSIPENVSEIARHLRVAYLVEGSVQRSGDAVRVNVQLIKAATDSHVWADTLDRKLTDVFSVQSEVAKAIADKLGAHVTGREEQALAATPTSNPEAYDAYLRGLAFTLKAGGATPANALGAQRHLRDAVRLDPQFALAWALLSIVDSRGYVTAALQPTVELREEARLAADSAMKLQPELGEALYAQGYYHYACRKDYGTAVQLFHQARRFLPNSSRIPESLAYVARRRGEWEQSETYFNEAERLDPQNVHLLRQHAASYTSLRRFPDALRKLDEVLNVTPEDVHTIAQKGSIALARGELPEAAALLQPLRPTADDPTSLAAQAYRAILERRCGDVIPRLEEILAKPELALGYFNSELRFWLGWARHIDGDAAAARANWEQARGELEAALATQPENYSVMGYLALTSVSLGEHAKALAFAEQAMSAITIDKDALLGPFPLEILARVAAQSGDHSRAIEALEKLLAIPYAGPMPNNVPMTPALLRLDPMFDPLRGDARFQNLLTPPRLSP